MNKANAELSACLIFVVYISILLVKLFSVGGIDLVVYKKGIENIDLTDLYYLKECVSWLIIYLADSLIGDPVKWFLIFDLIFFSIIYRECGVNKAFLITVFAMTLPMYYLMSMNILRQWISVVFLTGMTIEILAQKRVNLLSLVYLILAALSHNMSIVLAASFILVTVIAELTYGKIISVVIAALLTGYVFFQFFIADFDLLAVAANYADQVIDEDASPYKKYYYLAIAFFPIFANFFAGFKVDLRWSYASVVMVILPFPDWIVERFLIASAFISVVTFVYQLLHQEYKIQKVLVTLSIFNLIITFSHSGVLVVLFGD